MAFHAKTITWKKTAIDVRTIEDAGCKAAAVTCYDKPQFRFLPSVGTWSRTIPPAVEPVEAVPAYSGVTSAQTQTRKLWQHRPSVGTWHQRLPVAKLDAKQASKNCIVASASDPPVALAIHAPSAPAPASRRPRSRGQATAHVEPSEETSQEQVWQEQASQQKTPQEESVSGDVARMDTLLQDAEASVST